MDLSQLTPVLGLFGVIVGALAVLSGTVLTQRNLWKIEVLKDARALRDAKRERVRVLYDGVLVNVLDAATDVGRIGTAPDEEAKRKLSDEVLIDLEKASARLQLEIAAARVSPLVERFIGMMRGEPHQDDLTAFIGELRLTMQQSLAALEQNAAQTAHAHAGVQQHVDDGQVAQASAGVVRGQAQLANFMLGEWRARRAAITGPPASPAARS